MPAKERWASAATRGEERKRWLEGKMNIYYIYIYHLSNQQYRPDLAPRLHIFSRPIKLFYFLLCVLHLYALHQSLSKPPNLCEDSSPVRYNCPSRLPLRPFISFLMCYKYSALDTKDRAIATYRRHRRIISKHAERPLINDTWIPYSTNHTPAVRVKEKLQCAMVYSLHGDVR